MHPMSDRDQSIVAQVAVKAAVDLMGSMAPTMLIEDLMVNLTDISERVFSLICDIGQMTPTDNAVNIIQQEIPGATVVQAPPVQAVPQQQMAQPPFQQNVIPMQAQAQQAAPQQQGIHAGSSFEELWTDVIQNGANWEDCRMTKQSPNFPDFKHRFLKKADGKDIALWTHYQGQLKAPAFAVTALNIQ